MPPLNKLKTRAQRLNGIFPLAYMGVVPVSPTNFVIETRPPTTADFKNFYIGDLWLDEGTNTPPTSANLWMLVDEQQNSATWINFGGGAGALQALVGNDGIVVPPNILNHINVIGNTAQGLQTVGNAGTNTLTIETTGGGPIGQTITGNSGGAVQPDGVGNWFLLGTAPITVTGNPATHTLAISSNGTLATIYHTDSGNATPAAGILNILTQNATNQAGSTVLFSAPGALNTVQLNVTDANNNTIIGKLAGNLALAGTNNTMLGEGAGSALATGSNNILIGKDAGSSYTGAESKDIILGVTGTLGESNTIRVGRSADQTAAYMGGIYLQNNDIATREMVMVDVNDKLATNTMTALPWTPTVSFGGSSAGITYSVQEGKYNKIGALVFFSGGAILTNKGAAVGTARIEGLPFASSGTATVYQGFMAIGNANFTAGYTYTWGQIDVGTTRIIFKEGGSGQPDAFMTNANFTNTTAFTCTGFYFTA